ncbi:MAG: rhodanese-like domain-containing protein [Sporichthyaceae bacterium]|nr:rhodanese-like domain-containing protein [Sporichthyaceae bacterium]
MKEAEDLNPRQVLDQKDGLQIVDVREPNEWAGGHIEGAHHIPMNDLPARLAEIDRDRPVVTVCRSGARSGQVATYLAQAGFTVHNMDGGMVAWERQRLPVERPQGGSGTGAGRWSLFTRKGHSA